MFCNAALVAVVLKSGGLNRLSVKPVAIGKDDQSRTVKVYLLIVLWSVAGLSFFKFVGAMWYKIKRIVSTLLSFDETLLTILVRTLMMMMMMAGVKANGEWELEWEMECLV